MELGTNKSFSITKLLRASLQHIQCSHPLQLICSQAGLKTFRLVCPTLKSTAGLSQTVMSCFSPVKDWLASVSSINLLQFEKQDETVSFYTLNGHITLKFD